MLARRSSAASCRLLRWQLASSSGSPRWPPCHTGRPVCLLVLADGSLLVSDDEGGAVFRIWYAG